MHIEQQKQGKWSVLAITGRIDGQTAPQLEATLKSTIESGDSCIAADLSDVEYLSSAGLRVFLSTMKLLSGGSGQLCLLKPIDPVMEVLDISGFSSILQISNSLEE